MKRCGLWLVAALMASQVQAQPYAAQSVLSSGTWHKIGITQTGIYRLDAAFLGSLGITSADPRNIRIYGNGGGMLPQQNSAFRYDDLQENPIFVAGEADGVFNSGDFILFYAEGPHLMRWDSARQEFEHEYHLYADTNFYYLTVAASPGLRVAEASDPGPASFVSSFARNGRFWEADLYNPISSGRYWLGDAFSDINREKSFVFMMPERRRSGQIRLSARAAGRSDRPTSFQVQAGGVGGTLNLAAVNFDNYETLHYQADQRSFSGTPSTSSDSLRVTLTYNGNSSSRSTGWLDWIRVSYEQDWDTRGTGWQFFHLVDGTAPGAVASIRIANGSSAYQIWDISTPVAPQRIPYVLNGSQMEFRIAADKPRRLAVFRDGIASPASVRPLANQNLHGLNMADYLIIAHPDFIPEAQRLADFHQSHYGRSTAIVTPGQIYQEFSSGKQDVSAIRDFIRMWYLRSGGIAPSWVCLFGDGSYAYKNYSPQATSAGNFVPTYQSRDSWNPDRSYVSDDFYGLLDENEGYWGESSFIEDDTRTELNLIDVPIGRLPVENLQQAREIVDKIIDYATNPDYFGNWRNRVVLVGDWKDGEGSTHVRQSNGYTPFIEAARPSMEIDKIFMDYYPVVVSAGKTAFPEARRALLDALDAGSLIVNWTGHGNEDAWSNSQLFLLSDISKMQNKGAYPAVVTATCEYGRFDNPEKRTGAELLLMTPEAGAIAMFTTVRLVYSTPNEAMNQNFYRHAFSFDSAHNHMITLGEIMRRTKNSTFVRGNFTNINSRNFTLLGDPGLILNYPELQASVTHINDQPIGGGLADTLRSLSLVTVRGIIQDAGGQPLPTYEGMMDVTVFDKPGLYTTRLEGYSFYEQKNRIFSGTTLVKNGAFEFSFVVPIDISYEPGKGKFSLYFSNGERDGAGYYDNLHIGGTDAGGISDAQGPEVRLYINDANWISGSITSPNPDLYAEVRDESGINAVGSGVGHDMIAVLDGDEANAFLLNAYYRSLPGSYQEGSIRYPMRDLALGEHTLRIRVWDVANNPAEAETRFIVADDARMALGQVLNFPNPFRADEEETVFRIGHNQDGSSLSARIEILTPTGQLVKQIEAEFEAGGNVYEELRWDGNSDQGLPLMAGWYVYRVTLRNPETGQSLQEASKLVLLR